MLILPNSFVHCFVLCVWVRVSRPCMLLLALDVPVSVGLCLCASRVVFFSWCCGALLFRCCCSVFLVWLPSRFLLPWWLGCLRFGPLSPGFPLPPLPPWLSSGVFWSSQCSAGPSLRISGCIRNGPVVIPLAWRVVLIGSCLHSASWQQRLRPCVGLCPLHHVVGVVHVPLAPALRYSPSGGPESP